MTYIGIDQDSIRVDKTSDPSVILITGTCTTDDPSVVSNPRFVTVQIPYNVNDPENSILPAFLQYIQANGLDPNMDNPIKNLETEIKNNIGTKGLIPTPSPITPHPQEVSVVGPVQIQADQNGNYTISTTGNITITANTVWVGAKPT